MNTMSQLTDHLPSHTETEVEALREDIKIHGLKVPVVIDDSNNVIDGRLRAKLCDELKIHWWQTAKVESGLTDDQKAALRIRLNLLRRSTPPTASQRREYLKTLLKADPNMSNATIGRVCGMDASSVSRIRSQMETNGEIEAAKSTTGLDGRIRQKVQRSEDPKNGPQHDGDELNVSQPQEDTNQTTSETTVQNQDIEDSPADPPVATSNSVVSNQSVATDDPPAETEGGYLACSSFKLKFFQEVSAQEGSWEWSAQDEKGDCYLISCRRMEPAVGETRKVG